VTPFPDRSNGAGPTLLALFALTVGACRTGPDVPSGSYSGDFTVSGRVPTSVTWRVVRDESGAASISLEFPLMHASAAAPLTVTGDTLDFELPRPFGRSCRGVRGPDGAWRGVCRSSAGPGPGWPFVIVPPGSDLPVGVARLASESPGFRWRASRAGRAIVYTRAGTSARRHLARVVREAREAVRAAARILGEPGFTGPVRLYYLEDRQEMASLVGRPVRGWTDAGAGAVLLVADSAGGSPVFHEVAHVVSLRMWGYLPSSRGWIQEGVAEWVAGGGCGGIPWGRFERRLDDRGEALSLQQITEEYWRHPDRTTLPAAASLVGFVARTGGLEAVHGLWTGGIDSAPEVLHMSVPSLERAWRSDLRSRYRPASDSLYGATLGRPDGCPWPRPG